MSREILSSYAKQTTILVGGVCLAFALANFPTYGLTPHGLNWGFVLVVTFAVLVAPRLSLALPRSRFAISFSDAAVFLAFLFFGGPAAILVAALETFANCLYLRSRGYSFGRLMIPANVAINAVSISVTYLIWLNVPRASFITAEVGSSQHLLSTLVCVALIHFFVSSFLAAVFQSLKD